MNKAGETSLTSSEVRELAPEYTSSKGQREIGNTVIHANNVKPHIDAILKLAGAQHGFDPNQDFMSRIKNPETITEKIAEHRKEGLKDYGLPDVGDVYGARFVAKTPQQKAAIVNEVRRLGSNNQIKLLEEQAIDKGPYHAYHMNFNAGGVNGEIQIHDPHSLFEAVMNHPLYNEYGEKAPRGVKQAQVMNARTAYSMPQATAQQIAQAIELTRQKMGAQ